MTDESNDPLKVWQNMIGEMGKRFNAFAYEAMASPGSAKADQTGGLSADAQKQFGDLMEKYLVASRVQMADMAERLQSIELQLKEITTLLRDLPGRGAGAAPKSRRAIRPQPPPGDGD